MKFVDNALDSIDKFADVEIDEQTNFEVRRPSWAFLCYLRVFAPLRDPLFHIVRLNPG